MSEPIRLIRGRRTDSGDPGGEAAAILYAPEPPPHLPDEPGCRVQCRFLRDTDFFIFGVDDMQRVQLAVSFACSLLWQRGVRDIVVSVIPPEDRERIASG